MSLSRRDKRAFLYCACEMKSKVLAGLDPLSPIPLGAGLPGRGERAFGPFKVSSGK